MSGVLYVAAGVALVELWRRGYLASIIGSFTSAAEHPVDYASRRKFTLPTLGGGGSGGRLS